MALQFNPNILLFCTGGPPRKVCDACRTIPGWYKDRGHPRRVAHAMPGARRCQHGVRLETFHH